MIDAPFESAADDDLVLPALAILREHFANRVIAPGIATDRGQGGADVEYLVPDPEMLGQEPASSCTEARRISLGQHHPVDPLLAYGADRKCSADRAVDTARHRDHKPSAGQISRKNLAHARANLLDDFVAIELEHACRECTLRLHRHENLLCQSESLNFARRSTG